MGAKIIRHPRTGKPIPPKNKGKAAAGQRRGRAAAGQRAQRGRQNHRGYPDGHGPGGYTAGQRQGYAGQDGDGGDETVVVCEAPETTKKKFPWGTVLLTGIVSTAGVIAAYKIYEKFTGEKGGGRTSNPEPDTGQQALLNARDYLLLAAPGAENAIGRLPPPPQPVINTGPTQREIELMEREAVLRERMAEMEGFIQGQIASAQQQDNLSALLEAAEGDD